MAISEKAVELLKKNLGNGWKASKGGKPFDMKRGDQKIEIKSSSNSFEKCFGAVSVKELIESLESDDYEFRFVNNISSQEPKVTVIKPQQLFQIISKFYTYPKFTKKNKNEIKNQFTVFRIDSNGNTVKGTMKIGRRNEKMEKEAMKTTVKNIDEVIKEFKFLERLLKKRIKEME